MKRTIVSAFVFVVFVSSVHAQNGSRRRPVSAQPPIGSAATILDATDPFAAVRPPLAPDPATPRLHAGNPVPVSQLRIPSKAIKEFERAQKASQSGDVQTEVQHLEKAVQIYPDFLQAHNLLGGRYIFLHRYDEGLQEYRRTLAIDPNLRETYHNLAVALYFVARYQEAEEAARHSLELNSEEPATRYVLARILVQQGKITPEAMQLLHQTQDKFPNSNLVLAQIHFALGQTDQLIAALRRYLRAPRDADNKKKAECWVAQLSQQPLPTGCPAEVTRPTFR